jgi:hypothetical protein
MPAVKWSEHRVGMFVVRANPTGAFSFLYRAFLDLVNFQDGSLSPRSRAEALFVSSRGA